MAGENEPQPSETDAVSADERAEVQAHASPEGIVAVLFTDDVGSTRVRQRLGDQAAQERMREHNQIVRDQIGKHGGHEVKAMGDGFMVVFSDVGAALACAVDIQQAVAEDNERRPDAAIEVRIGLNAGQAIKDEEDFFGGAVIVAARLEGLARPGQILVSETVRGLAGLRPDVQYVSYGRRRLKGLAGRYEVWRVPWCEEHPSLPARLWARPVFRVAAPVLMLAAVGGGTAAGVMLGGGGADEGNVQEIAYHIEFLGGGEQGELSGNCLTEDLVLRPPAVRSPPGDATGDVSGHVRNTSGPTARFYASDDPDEACRSGYIDAAHAFTDAEGNTLEYALEGPASLTATPAGDAVVVLGSLAATITGGTGVYDGARGTGACEVLTVTRSYPPEAEQPGPVPGSGTTEIDCTLRLRASTAGADEPFIVQLVAEPSEEVGVVGGPQAASVGAAVVYVNTRDESQRGLSLRLPEPDGARIRTAGRGADEEPVAGERVWDLPELAPGESGVLRFTLQFLSAERLTVPLVVEMDGDGFDGPVRSEPVTIQVVQ